MSRELARWKAIHDLRKIAELKKLVKKPAPKRKAKPAPKRKAKPAPKRTRLMRSSSGLFIPTKW